jgi:lambda family phage portal protein
MGKLATRLYNRWFGDKPTQKRYAAGRISRLQADWTTWPTSANWQLRQDLRTLRARSRQMCRDAPHFKKFLRMVRTNVIGPKGLQLMVRAYQPDGKTLDAELNKRVQNAWWEWSFAENCSSTGKLNWLGAQRLFATHLARDGEVLVQKIAANNPFGFSIKFWNVDWLDETWSQDLPDGNRIVMSVEIDQNDRPVAYWLTEPASDVAFQRRQNRPRRRIDASEIIHCGLVIDDESQVRFVPWFHAVLIEGKNYEQYKGGVINSAKLTAYAAGIFTKKDPDETEFSGEDDKDGQELDMNFDIKPGSFHIGPDGYDFSQFDPKQPTQNHAEFCRTIMGDIAAGLDVPYFDLTGDLSNVNYSSARVGQADERDVWRELQDFVGEMFCRPVYHAWLRSAVISGALKLKQREFAEVQNPMWNPRGWRYVDPQKEIGADVEGLANNIKTLTGVLAEQGIDIIDHFETLQHEKELAAEYGIELNYVSKITATEAAPTDGSGEEKPAAKAAGARELTNGHGLEHLAN